MGDGEAGEAVSGVNLVQECVQVSWGEEVGREFVACDGQVLWVASVRDAPQRGKAYFGASPKVCFALFCVFYALCLFLEE